ncbi:MAG: LON peptidase substrate-binding domain-containing protein [Gemmatimonadales bacterium]|nr:LON peptidase substrate-binding domain-containing protein [Gemmatimonadales bacterium]
MAASTRLPLFPLDVVLFPGVPLPLHIFEPRYRQMLADVMADDHRFGLLPTDPNGRPPTGTIGCVGAVTETRMLPDGRSNLILTGIRRFVVRRYVVVERPYDVALIDEFSDELGTEPEADDVERLRALHIRHVELLGLVDALPAALPGGAGLIDAEALSFQAAATLHTDPIKRRLLETRSTEERVQTLLRLLPALVSSAEAAAAVQLKSQANGKGTHHPDVAT